ncbi:MAG: hypothetical protein CVT82_14990 [Alphaproteobacteria bacterium HGW-Alphaproteobacteria-4]|nr:MAG: hypothetical protein CVT82_14990 [Alphaproteobacteria bacterium HGW-Alphaproteobacteria-4]
MLALLDKIHKIIHLTLNLLQRFLCPRLFEYLEVLHFMVSFLNDIHFAKAVQFLVGQMMSFVNLEMQIKLGEVKIGQISSTIAPTYQLLRHKLNIIIKLMNDTRNNKELPPLV